MPRRIMQGTVVSDKGDKTIIVLVEHRGKSSDLEAQALGCSHRRRASGRLRLNRRLNEEV